MPTDFTGQPITTFGYNAEAVGYAIWQLERSTDLQSWTEIYSASDPANGADSPRPNIIADQNYYRFRAELTPQN